MAAHSKVAAFIAFHVDNSGKLQREIADEAGLDKQNIISMLKTGATKVPLARVPKLAKALGVDPKKLFQLCIEEYQPDVADVIAEIYDSSMLLSDNEIKLVKKVRSLSKNSDPSLTGHNEPYLKQFVEKAV